MVSPVLNREDALITWKNPIAKPLASRAQGR